MNLPKLMFVVTTTVAVVGASFVGGMYSAIHETAAYRLVGRVYLAVKESFRDVSETAILSPHNFLQPSRRAGTGVTVNRKPDDGSLILLAGFFERSNELRLIRRDGTVVNRWPVRFSALFPDPDYMTTPRAPATDWNIDLHGALARPDGSVVFNFEYGGLAKLDRCGRPVWALREMTHHSVEPSEAGGYWVPGRREITEGGGEFPPFHPPYVEDLLLHVSEDGRVLTRMSVPGILYRNGLSALLTATGDRISPDMEWDRELVHLNKIAELPVARAAMFPMFRAGDLMLSLREHNLIFVFEPDTQKVKWWQTGPWVRQHDPEFRADGMITVFNNNAYRSALVDGKSSPSLPRTSNILAIDPATRSVRVEYGDRAGQEMLTVLRGRQSSTSEGGLLVTEFEGGRVFEADRKGELVWEYVNRYDDQWVAEVSDARIYAAGFFRVADWTCPRDPQ